MLYFLNFGILHLHHMLQNFVNLNYKCFDRLDVNLFNKKKYLIACFMTHVRNHSFTNKLIELTCTKCHSFSIKVIVCFVLTIIKSS